MNAQRSLFAAAPEGSKSPPMEILEALESASGRHSTSSKPPTGSLFDAQWSVDRPLQTQP
jgi:hypothetical protein